MVRLVCLLIGYVFGLFQTGYIYGKLNGIDIRNHGSGNAGTTNMLRTLGKKAGALTLIGDALKCILAVVLVRAVFGSSYPDILPLLSFYAAAGVILGHNFPFYLGFRGGKGIAATAGLIISLNWVLTLCTVVVFVLTLLITHYVSLGSILIYLGLVVELIIMGQNGAFGMAQIQLNEMYGISIVLCILAIWMHRTNIRRLLSGTERKTFIFKKII